MHHTRKSKAMEWIRNILLILLAAVALIIFFNLDMIHEGDSVFTNSARKQLKFSGDLDRKDFTSTELDRFLNYLSARKKLIKEIKIDASPQDSYRKVTPSTEILFEIHVTMTDGFTFSTPVRRSKRNALPKAIIIKLDKDIQAYFKLKKEGKKIKSLINTM